MVVIHHHRASNLNRNTLPLQAKKMIELEHTTSALLQEMSHSLLSPHMTLSTRNQMATLLILEHTNKIHIELHLDLIGMIEEDISKIMAEAANNTWLSASPHQDKELPLRADIAEDAR